MKLFLIIWVSMCKQSENWLDLDSSIAVKKYPNQQFKMQ